MLDEGVPKPLAAKLRALDVDAVAFPNGWKQLSNGKLLDAIEGDGFNVLVTNDKSIPHQQNLRGRRIAVLVLPTNRLRDVLANVERVAQAVVSAEPGVVVRMSPFPDITATS